ncbi:glycosyltransferase [Aerococcus viridans]|uniref:glycosyltransferase n=1 Tax=Aerococcus viridans TaxID=1377 RepID=UPI003AA96F08
MIEKYSVLMSLYQKENPEWFEASMDSMINQTIAPDEIVLVLDGPIKEDLMELVNNYKRKYRKLIKVLPLAENIGLGKALDEGLAICSNNLVARMDTDDISLPSRCEKQLQEFTNNSNLAIIGTNIDEFYDDPNNIISSREVPSSNLEIKKFIKRRSPFNHPTVMFKKEVVLACGGYGNLRRKQDLDLFSRIVNSGYEATNLNESLLLFRSNENNFKRRKSWSYVKSYIIAQYTIWRRGHCNIWDLLYVVLGQIVFFILPIPILKMISNKFLRTNTNLK